MYQQELAAALGWLYWERLKAQVAVCNSHSLGGGLRYNSDFIPQLDDRHFHLALGSCCSFQ